jgi:LysR family carnitine catabolism transcriptional activator
MRMNQISVDQMRTIVCIADQGGFTPAATVLGQSQSSLSRTVALVEKAVGTRLFDRTTRSFATTATGTEFLRTARTVVEYYDRAVNNFTSYLDGPAGTLRIATLPSLAATLLPSFIGRFHRAFPNVTVDLLDLKAVDIIDLCRQGTVDLAITAEDADLTASLPPSFGFSPVAEEGFACILPENHPLTAQDTVDWPDLADQPFISFTRASSVRRITDRAFAAAGFAPSRTVSAGTISAVAGLCAAGLGVSAVPGFVIPMTRVAGVVTRPLSTGAVTRRIGVLQDADRAATPAVEEFLALVRGSTGAQLRLPEFTRWTGLD